MRSYELGIFCQNFDFFLAELQRELLLYDARNLQTSFISEPWFDMYLSDRVPCPINYNPFMVYAPDPNKEYNDQVKTDHFLDNCMPYKE